MNDIKWIIGVSMLVGMLVIPACFSIGESLSMSAEQTGFTLLVVFPLLLAVIWKLGGLGVKVINAKNQAPVLPLRYRSKTRFETRDKKVSS